ncbi:MAG TPA: PAS and helix-turn-helix domain-containing protein [Smithella sp.]|nr:PAS and helix-turn-helix domain-containing protein [Smithella sp.]
MKGKNLKELQDKLVRAYFMKAPHPMAITRADDGTYIELNEASVKYMGSSREKMIGCKSTETGHMPLVKREIIINEIKAKGFAKNIEVVSTVQTNEVLHLLFNVFPIKLGRESFFLSVVTDISKSKHRDDILFRLRLPDTARIMEKLEQFSFSPRKLEVAFLASYGYSNRKIAEKLFISENTVKEHLKEIYKQIGVRRRSEINPKILNWR